uniref:Uncharacterized protein n=1 Tax=Bionectria ochroleuca TaxID=29856 RepID=A0A0B7KBE5_BIOOC
MPRRSPPSHSEAWPQGPRRFHNSRFAAWRPGLRRSPVIDSGVGLLEQHRCFLIHSVASRPGLRRFLASGFGCDCHLVRLAAAAFQGAEPSSHS